MSEPASHFERSRTIDEHIEWWADRVERRMLGNVRRSKGHKTGPPKEAWNRIQFLRGLWAIAPDYPAEEKADKFERAIDRARGNPSRFRLELGRELG